MQQVIKLFVDVEAPRSALHSNILGLAREIVPGDGTTVYIFKPSHLMPVDVITGQEVDIVYIGNTQIYHGEPNLIQVQVLFEAPQ